MNKLMLLTIVSVDRYKQNMIQIGIITTTMMLEEWWYKVVLWVDCPAGLIADLF